MEDLEKIADIMKEAGRFSERALASLTGGMAGDPELQNTLLPNPARAEDALRVHFLFPNLDDRERLFLAELLAARRGLHEAKNTDRRGLTPAELEQYDRANADFQSRYVNARAELTHLNSVAKMTPLQRKIVEHEFFSLPVSPPPTEAASEGPDPAPIAGL